MKGFVFTELLDMVKDVFGMQQVDHIIQCSDLPSQGAYTAVGTYNYQEMLQLVSQLSESTSIEQSELVKSFGEYLFGRLAVSYPHLFKQLHSMQDVLLRVDDFIHVEVHKLYPPAELPRVLAQVRDEHCLEVNYTSTRPFADLAEGLIRGCAKHFQEEVTIDREDLSDPPGCEARFVIYTEQRVEA